MNIKTNQNLTRENSLHVPDYVFLGYCVSKIGMSRLTGLQAHIAESDPRPGILINAVRMPQFYI